MERLCRWRKTAGVFNLDGRRIGPGEEFDAYPSQVPLAFRDTIQMVTEKKFPEAKAKAKPESESPVVPSLHETVAEAKHEVQSDSVEADVERFYAVRRSGGWYDVRDFETGKVVNQRAMRKPAAEQLARELNNGNT